MTKSEDWDVVVIGAGSAAFESAVAARQSGAEHVLMVEKADEAEAGGNARFSHTGFRFCYSGPEDIRPFLPDVDPGVFERMAIPPYTREDYLDDLNSVTDGRIDPDLAAAIADDSNEAVNWMRECGIEWDLGHHIIINGALHFEPGIVVHPAGGGLGQLKGWKRIAAEQGVRVRYNSAVTGISGSVAGIDAIRVNTPDGPQEIRAKAVIACSGGFQANREMRARYLEGQTDLMKVRGSRHNTGEVLRLMLDAGARSAGHWQGAHATPIDGSAPEYEVPVRSDGMGSWTNRYYYMYGITVNRLGRRFFDEGESHQSYTYAKTGAAVLSQPHGTAFQIYDRRGTDVMKPHAESHLETRFQSDSLEELAKQIGINPVVFLETVREYNEACDPSAEFDATRMDGNTTKGLTPPKSNWAMPIETPPFSAYPVTGGITFTFGGVEIDANAQVVGITGRPIPGLYAVGDITGVFYHNYPSCTGQTRNAVFARRAARHAAGAAA